MFYRDPVTMEPFSEYAPGRLPFNSRGLIEGPKPVPEPKEPSYVDVYNEQMSRRLKAEENRIREQGYEADPEFRPEAQQNELREFLDRIAPLPPMPQDTSETSGRRPHRSNATPGDAWLSAHPAGATPPPPQPLPPGMPSGSVRIDDDTYQLPDGRVIRRRRG